MDAHDFTQLIERIATPRIFGPLHEGVYVQVGIGMGFYVPEEAFNRAQQLADESHSVQFLAVTKEGEPIHGTREDCLRLGSGSVAWIVPR